MKSRMESSASGPCALAWLPAAAGLLLLLVGAASADASDWPLYSHDYNNSNYNADETGFRANEARFLRRA